MAARSALAAARSSAYCRTDRHVLARVRSDAPHHTGARRRRGDAFHPPDVAQVLRLQRTIGNRATTRLLQRDPIEEEVAAERARFDAAKRTHERHLVQFAERPPHALKRAGITTDSRSTRTRRSGSRPRSRRAGSCAPSCAASSRARPSPTAASRSTATRTSFNQAAQLAANDQRPLTEESARRRVRGHGRLVRPHQQDGPRPLAHEVRQRAPRGDAQGRAPGLPRLLGGVHQRGRDAALHRRAAQGAGALRGDEPQVPEGARVRQAARRDDQPGAGRERLLPQRPARSARRSRAASSSTPTRSARRSGANTVCDRL